MLVFLCNRQRQGVNADLIKLINVYLLQCVPATELIDLVMDFIKYPVGCLQVSHGYADFAEIIWYDSSSLHCLQLIHPHSLSC